MRRIKNIPTTPPKKKALKRLTMMGKITTSSTSNTKNRIAINKNRIEKGRRGVYLGENPHSKGLSFSISQTNFFPSADPTTPRINTKTQTKIKNTINIEITLVGDLGHPWGPLKQP